MTYIFPCAKFADENTITEQITAIGKEFAEICHASWGCEGIDRITEEILDTLHSCETALRIIEAEHGPGYVHDRMQAVIAKNTARGYYA
jgi:hypothetical protein